MQTLWVEFISLADKKLNILTFSVVNGERQAPLDVWLMLSLVSGKGG